ncbi:MAG: hypothetical protein FWE83_06575 [Oscillospiraceae bacterium]|nr:hypothetical protein [Oscillospiraceae bacterium]
MIVSKILSLCFIVISLLLLTACGVVDIVTEDSPEPVIEAPPTSESIPEPTPERKPAPTSEITPSPTPTPMPTQTPEPTPEKSPEPTPVITPEPDAVGFKFPFSFSSVDLYGNTITDEDLGEKELFFAYRWAVW